MMDNEKNDAEAEDARLYDVKLLAREIFLRDIARLSIAGRLLLAAQLATDAIKCADVFWEVWEEHEATMRKSGR